jgi:hypothetical protein
MRCADRVGAHLSRADSPSTSCRHAGGGSWNTDGHYICYPGRSEAEWATVGKSWVFAREDEKGRQVIEFFKSS